MLLYLVQHAQAKSEAEDPTRPLSREGEETVKRMGAFVRDLHPNVSTIWHSDKLRAVRRQQGFSVM